MKKFSLFLLLIISSFFLSCEKESDDRITLSQMLALYKEADVKLKKIKSKKIERYMNLPGDKSAVLPPDFTITEQEAIEVLTPLINSTPTYLSQNHQIDVFEFVSSYNDPKIAAMGAIAIRLDYLYTQGKVLDSNSIDLIGIKPLDPIAKGGLINNTENIGVERIMYAQPDLWDCAIRAFGIAAIAEYFSGNLDEKAKKKALKGTMKKTLFKVASRTISWVGWGIALYEFGDCMETW